MNTMLTVCREHIFKDSCLFYRFIDDEQTTSATAAPPTHINEFNDRKQYDDELVNSLTLLYQIGPDATLRAILRKP
jgi:Rap guanine nucleotide exchange factor 4